MEEPMVHQLEVDVSTQWQKSSGLQKAALGAKAVVINIKNVEIHRMVC
jgi:hypothetical protein